VKLSQVPQPAAENPVRVEFKVQFSEGPKGRRQDPASAPESSVSPDSYPIPEPTKVAGLGDLAKITRLLVLGHHFENLVRQGVVKDYAEIARLTGLSRARVTQIANLTLLSPEIQEAALQSRLVDAKRLSTERRARCLTTYIDWHSQKQSWLLLGNRT